MRRGWLGCALLFDLARVKVFLRAADLLVALDFLRVVFRFLVAIGLVSGG